MKFTFAVISFLTFLLSSAQAKPFTVMAYNAENFFDTMYDPSTDDITWLPMSTKEGMADHEEKCQQIQGKAYVEQCLNIDWNKKIYKKKIQAVSRVIKSFDASGKGPDVVVLVEIENKRVLNDLVSSGLAESGYDHAVLIEGDDLRGIDVAILSRYPVVRKKRHPIVLKGEKLNTRGILEVELNIKGLKVVVFGHHWPSQQNPVTERMASAKLLNKLAQEASADLVLAMGDFNTLPSESPKPFKELQGFKDAEAQARKMSTKLMPGTHFFKNKWESLDKIFVMAGKKVLPMWPEFEIMARSFMMEEGTKGPVPVRFNAETGAGFSDHLPVKMKFLIP